jgi:hypothetical protein
MLCTKSIGRRFTIVLLVTAAMANRAMGAEITSYFGTSVDLTGTGQISKTVIFPPGDSFPLTDERGFISDGMVNERPWCYANTAGHIRSSVTKSSVGVSGSLSARRVDARNADGSLYEGGVSAQAGFATGFYISEDTPFDLFVSADFPLGGPDAMVDLELANGYNVLLNEMPWGQYHLTGYLLAGTESRLSVSMLVTANLDPVNLRSAREGHFDVTLLVPEPATLSLLALGGLLFARRLRA